MRICISFCGAQGEERAAATLVSSVSCWWMVSEAVEEVGVVTYTASRMVRVITMMNALRG